MRPVIGITAYAEDASWGVWKVPAALAPLAYVTKDDAPTLLLHGTADTVVPTLQSQALVSALKVAGVDTTLELQIGQPHDVNRVLSPLAMQQVNAFFDQTLRGVRRAGGTSNYLSTPFTEYVDPVALDLGEQDPVGHHLDHRRRADLVGEAHGVAALEQGQLTVDGCCVERLRLPCLKLVDCRTGIEITSAQPALFICPLLSLFSAPSFSGCSDFLCFPLASGSKDQHDCCK
jgi:hypothetical protein